MTACMGGWCAKRGQCADFHAEDRSNPVERLCKPGEEFPTAVRTAPVIVTRPAPLPKVLEPA